MVAVGYEPDLYVQNELNDPDDVKGTAAEYKSMWKNFVRIFEEEGADNVVWIMDYSFKIKDRNQIAIDLWPEDNVVQWLFFNIFQF